MLLNERVVDRRYLSTEEAVMYIGLSRWTLLRLSKERRLPATVIGSRVLYDVLDLDQLMKENIK
jgi:excisionase family DNA binding protein